ncbi:MAG: hypothetical protein AAF429_09790 [Pseudomonadota bacterium]
MIYLIFGLSFLASAYSIWRGLQSRCDQREANLALGVLPLVIAILLYVGWAPYEKLVAFGILFMGGVAIVGESGWRRLVPAYQIGFAIWVMVGVG